jgi:hypothetical protein
VRVTLLLPVPDVSVEGEDALAVATVVLAVWWDAGTLLIAYIGKSEKPGRVALDNNRQAPGSTVTHQRNSSTTTLVALR